MNIIRGKAYVPSVEIGETGLPNLIVFDEANFSLWRQTEEQADALHRYIDDDESKLFAEEQTAAMCEQLELIEQRRDLLSRAMVGMFIWQLERATLKASARHLDNK